MQNGSVNHETNIGHFYDERADKINELGSDNDQSIPIESLDSRCRLSPLDNADAGRSLPTPIG